MKNKTCRSISICLLTLFTMAFPQTVYITGKIINRENVPQVGVIVRLKGINLADTTVSDGIYLLSTSKTVINNSSENTPVFPTKITGSFLTFSVQQEQFVSLVLFDLRGRRIETLLQKNLPKGNFSCNR
ncbi:MAG: hypothetical protein JW795_22585 [Chitinivibrionales bacterium]|nr:hypothetical protein [Chitinivibrionales bacterium]